jgi:hypothetical protein
MSTSSSDSTYEPPPDTASLSSEEDDFSANALDDLADIYTDPNPFDIMDYETAISQQAFLHF